MTYVALGDVTRNLDAKRVPVRSSSRQPGPYPYYGASGIVDWVSDFLFEGRHLLVAEDGENLRSRNTPVAFLADGKFWVNNHAHVLTAVPGISDIRYLCYQLQLTDMTGYLTGSAQPKLNRSALDSIQIWLPDLATQTAIADVLGALDDKIAANEQMVTALDSLVRAMVEGGMQGESVRVGDVASLVSLKSNGGGPVVTYLGLEHLPRRRLWAQDSGLSSEVTSQKSVFEEGDLLFGKLRPYFHKVVVAQHSGVCSTDILVVRAIDEELRGWMWAALASDDVVAAVTASSTGTRMPRASWGDLSEVQVPWPGRSEAARVSRQIESLNARAGAAVAESRRLAATRDALLPELMSGRLKVKGIAEGARE